MHDVYPLQPTLALIAAATDRPLNVAHRINKLTVAASDSVLALLPAYTTPRHAAVVLRELTDVGSITRIWGHKGSWIRGIAVSRRGGPARAVIQEQAA